MPNNKTAAIRQEQPSDYKIIHKVVKKAFESAEHSDGNEQELVIMLRKSEAYIPELEKRVLSYDSYITGHTMLFPPRQKRMAAAIGAAGQLTERFISGI